MSDPLLPIPGEEWKPFAEGAIVCPKCGEVLPVTVLARLMHYPQPSGGMEKHLETEPQMDDVWAHWWTHGGGETARCGHWSGWVVYPTVTDEDARRFHCRLPLGHVGDHGDGETTWSNERSDG